MSNTVQPTGNGVVLEGETSWRSVFGVQKLLVNEADLLEEIRERFGLRGEQKLGRVRITVERLDDE